MKISIIKCAIVIIVTFCTGFFTSQIVNYYKNRELIEANNFKRELTRMQGDCIEMANKVMDNNNLWDSDGSDDMMNYLNLYCAVDSMYSTQL